MRVMSEAEWKAFLTEQPRTAKLATVRADGRPHVAPIWYDPTHIVAAADIAD